MGNKIIKLHGCSGAGKTTAARSFMASASRMHVVTKDGARRPEAYVCEFPDMDTPVTVLGSYANNCGGMDSYPSDAPSIIELLEFYIPSSHILMEGLLMSTYYGELGKHLEQYGDDAVFAFMDTPVIVCLQRVQQRRAENNSKNKFNPQNTIDKYNTIEHLKKKCQGKLGRRVVEIRYDADPVPQLLNIYRDAS